MAEISEAMAPSQFQLRFRRITIVPAMDTSKTITAIPHVDTAGMIDCGRDTAMAACGCGVPATGKGQITGPNHIDS